MYYITLPIQQNIPVGGNSLIHLVLHEVHYEPDVSNPVNLSYQRNVKMK